MGISYENSVMNLDLLERKNKHDNGFCHWPRVAWVRPDGSFQPAMTNFTSCADPKTVGSGLAACKVLFHEAGHAAHFAVRTESACPVWRSIQLAETRCTYLPLLLFSPLHRPLCIYHCYRM